MHLAIIHQNTSYILIEALHFLDDKLSSHILETVDELLLKRWRCGLGDLLHLARVTRKGRPEVGRLATLSNMKVQLKIKTNWIP